MNPIELYLRVREREGRIYTDQVVAHLPDYPDDQALSSEWRSRADSSARLTSYLSAKKRPLSILELGCGNGWLANRLALIASTHVWGLDRNSRELVQAARVFTRPNLAFLSADIFNAPLAEQSFDVIVLASVIQYFPDLAGLIQALKTLLKLRGEIHLLDSPLYNPDELPTAQERTQKYYAALGFPEMSGYYFHHLATDLDAFSPHWFYLPGNLVARLKRIVGQDISPFPWLVIGK